MVCRARRVSELEISNLKFEMALFTSWVPRFYRTETIDLRRGEWGQLWPFLRWREEQAPPLRPKS